MHAFGKKLVLILLLLGGFHFVQAQSIKSFTSDSEIYFQELEKLISESNPDEAEALMGELKAIWPIKNLDPKKEEKIYKKSNKLLLERYKRLKVTTTFQYSNLTTKLNDAQIELLVSVSNKMLRKRLKASSFSNLVVSLLSFVITYQTEDSFDAWVVTMDKLLDENKRNFTKFLKNCNNIFIYKAIYVSPNVRWMGTSDKFVFDYDSLPKVVFPEMDLFCVAKKDTSKIYGTEGVYYPTIGTWIGKGGKVLWTRAAKEEHVTRAYLNKYQIRLKSSEYTADSVTYINKKYFEGELKGVLKEKILANVTPERATYPRFNSYSKSVLVKEIEDSVDYEGGFSIQGGRFIGRGVEGARAKLIFKRNKEPFLIVKSKNFSMSEERMSTLSAAIVIRLDTDSITHPALKFKFLTKKRELTLYRERKGISASPYNNSFHKMDMFIEWLKWEIDKPKMEFSAIVGSNQGEVKFESGSYFSEQRFDELMGIGDVHPLYRIKKFILERNGEEHVFQDTDLAAYMTYDDQSVKRLLVKLATQGFLNYDIEKGQVTVLPRLFDYMNAKSKKGDYDNISIFSVMKGQPNAQMNLINYDISFKGVRGVRLSDARKTGFIPENRELKLHRGRDMSFGGILRSGRYEFHGKKFEFIYNDFEVKLAEVDSARLMAGVERKRDEDGKMPVGLVQSVIEDIKGHVKIDWPNNKSGIEADSFPEYPSFTCTKRSFVRYQHRNKRGGAYDPDKVYFQLDTFTVDSLGTFKNGGISFSGRFSSGGIFPDFDENLKLMPDHSLGFRRKTPPGGYPMYGGKANFKGDVILSNEGLMGDGDFEYITSTTKSKAFVFYLDSMNAVAQSSVIKPQKSPVEYTDAQGDTVKVAYYSAKDYFTMEKIKKPIKIYNKVAKLHGKMFYDKKGMTGKGMVDFDNAELTSNLFEFKNTTFNADTSNFKLKAANSDSVAFKAKNVNSKIDFEKRMGDFKNNGGATIMEFPMNDYICYMDQFKWFMDDFTLELSSSEKNAKKSEGTAAGGNDLDLSGAEFISTHPKQDSLKFISPKSTYDLKKYIINAHKVKYINVADARVFTADGEVIVGRRAKMKPLEKAKIIANTITQYHTFTDATVNIKAKKKYYAEGDYEYVDELGEKQKIRFNNITVDTVYQTVGSAEIKAADKFMLSPAFKFKGQANVFANKKGMLFDGGTMIVHDCKGMGKPWIPFKYEIDPKDVMIPVDTSMKSFGKKGMVLVSGLLLKKDSSHVYSTFLGPRKFHSDQQFTYAGGFLKYDKETSEYQISNKEKLNEITFPGNYVSLNKNTCEVKVEGRIDLDKKLGQVNFQTFGEAKHNPINDSVVIKPVLAIDFHLDDGMWKHMLSNIEGNPALQPISGDRTVFEKAVREMAGKKKGDKLISELSLYGQFKKVPDALNHKLVLSDFEMYWDQESSSYRTHSGGVVGLAIMGKKQPSRFVKGHVQLLRKRSKEQLTIYLEIDEKTWYYFSYLNGVMRCLSSSDDFNAIITGLKEGDREVKGDKKTGPYTFMLSTERSKRKFLGKMDD